MLFRLNPSREGFFRLRRESPPPPAGFPPASGGGSRLRRLSPLRGELTVQIARAGDSVSPRCPIGQGREYDVRCDMSHVKSRFNKFVPDRSIKAHGKGHRRLSEPAAQRRQVRQGLPDLARAEGARARAPRTTARRRRSPAGPHVLPGVRPRQEPQVHLR